MTLEAGKLRHRIAIQSRTESRDGTTGALTMTWATISNGTVWAAIEPLSTREFVAAGAVQSKVVARIIIRYRSDVLPTMRAVHGSKTYNIEGALPDKDSGREYLTLAVSEGVNLGA